MRLATIATLVSLGATGCLKSYVFDWPAGDAAIEAAAGDSTVDAVDAVDALDGSDALVETGPLDVVSEADVVLAAPRQIAPLSTTAVSAGAPTLTWLLAPGTDGGAIEICADRGFTRMCQQQQAMGSSAVVTPALSPGVWFWRVRGTVGTTTMTGPSATWLFTVKRGHASVQTIAGVVPDFNGDGFADIAIGEPGDNMATGAVRIYPGASIGPLLGTPLASLHGELPNTQWGAVSAIGDVNGDGLGDLAVAAVQFGGFAGKAYIYAGSIGQIVAPTPMATIVGTDGALTLFGFALPAGDVNHDGYGDVAIEAIGANSRAGRVYLFFGSPNGTMTTPSLTIDPPTNGGGEFGTYAGSAGDVNCDGFEDLLITAPRATNGSGAAYLYRGGATGLATMPMTLNADTTDTMFGSSASTADFNGDGCADLVIGAPQGNRVYPFKGSSSGPTPVAVLVGHDAGGFGSDVAAAGDIDGDGLTDLVVGASAVNNRAGRAYLYIASSGGFGSMPLVLNTPDDATAEFGLRVAHVGDVNGDGLFDFVVTAPSQMTDNGIAHLYLGAGTTGTSSSPIPAVSAAHGNFGSSVAGM